MQIFFSLEPYGEKQMVVYKKWKKKYEGQRERERKSFKISGEMI